MTVAGDTSTLLASQFVRPAGRRFAKPKRMGTVTGRAADGITFPPPRPHPPRQCAACVHHRAVEARTAPNHPTTPRQHWPYTGLHMLKLCPSTLFTLGS